MDARIIEFTDVLRQKGLRVGTSEVSDALAAISELGLGDRGLFHAALRATLVKRVQDNDTFEETFALFFSPSSQTFQALDASLLRQLSGEGLLEGDELQKLVAALTELRLGLSPLMQTLMGAGSEGMAGLLRGAALRVDWHSMESPLQRHFFTRQLLTGVGANGAQKEQQALLEALGQRQLSAHALEIVSGALSEALRSLEALARAEVERQSKARMHPLRPSLAQRALRTLSPGELEQVQRAVRRLAERLKARLARRERVARRGTLHVRRTLRKNASWGGIPMVPVFRAKRVHRPDVVILCDLSDSVRNVSGLMLLFMHTLQERFTRVRSFAFVSDVGEITDALKQIGPSEVLDSGVAERAISLSGNSNYGRVFALFVQAHLGAITPRTTVLIIGDGRSNYHSPNVWALEEIRRKAKRVVWICPEQERSWGVGDSEMAQYAPLCSQTLVVQSLSDLEKMSTQLLPK